MKPKRSLVEAFTLIELLVVVVIIGLLAALLVPAFSGARESGRKVRCASNLRELHYAVMNRVMDDAKFPKAGSYWEQDADQNVWVHIHGWVAWYDVAGTLDKKYQSNKPTDGKYDWQNASAGRLGRACITNGTLWRAIKKEDVYLCPTFAQRSICGSPTAARSYAMNTSVSGANIGLVANAARTVLFGDDRLVTNSPPSFDPDNGEIGAWHVFTNTVMGGQVVYLDGHVETRR